jgi:hypothetical protein
MVKPSSGDTKLDTLVLIAKTSTYFKLTSGNMYFFKYKLNTSDDWKTYTVGMQTADTTQYQFVYFLNGKSKTDFDEQQTIQEQFSKAIEAGKESARNEKYNNTGYDFDENIPFD